MKEIVTPLLVWYEKNKRDLPWRKDQEPYHIWISEIMLQQTRVEAVKGYYQRFMSRIKTIEELATIDEEELLKLWEGLGYYNRARNLKKAAEKVGKEYHGNFPSSYQELLTLPGIGSYTAGAIASISFREKVPAIDGNVLRVFSRLNNSFSNIDIKETKKDLFLEIKEILPDQVDSFNQALMELGALVCLPNTVPKCEECPLKDFCLAKKEGNVLQLPIRNQKKSKENLNYTIVILEKNNNVVIKKRPSTGILASLYEFITLEGNLSKKEIEQQLKEKGFLCTNLQLGKISKHIFTHQVWNMTEYRGNLIEKPEEYILADWKEIDHKYPLPGAFQSFKKEKEKF